MSDKNDDKKQMELFEEAFKKGYDTKAKQWIGATCLERNTHRRKCALYLEKIKDSKVVESLETKYGLQFADFHNSIKLRKTKNALICEGETLRGLPKQIFAGFRLFTVVAHLMYGVLILLPALLPVRLAEIVFLQKYVYSENPAKLPFYRICIVHMLRFCLRLWGIEIKTEGLENVTKWRESKRRLIGIYNHSSGLDPFVLTVSCDRIMKWTWVAKESLFYVLPGICIPAIMSDTAWPLDRSNRKKAIRVLNDSATVEGCPTCVAPEGTRSKTGHVLPELKKGAFHLQKDHNALFCPMVIYNTFELWPNAGKFPLLSSPGQVIVKFLPAVDQVEGEDMADTMTRVRQLLAEEAANYKKTDAGIIDERRAMNISYFVVILPLWFLWQFVCYHLVMGRSLFMIFLLWIQWRIGAHFF